MKRCYCFGWDFLPAVWTWYLAHDYFQLYSYSILPVLFHPLSHRCQMQICS
jgi:hypothetical protein